MAVNVNLLSPEWVRENWMDFARYARDGKPFFFAWESVGHQWESVFAKIEKQLDNPAYSLAKFMSVSLPITYLIEL
jgi:hypothetical protein